MVCDPDEKQPLESKDHLELGGLPLRHIVKQLAKDATNVSHHTEAGRQMSLCWVLGRSRAMRVEASMYSTMSSLGFSAGLWAIFSPCVVTWDDIEVDMYIKVRCTMALDMVM